MTQLARRVLVFPQVSVMGAHPAGIKYTGKYGYPVKSDLCVDNMSTTDAVASYDALLIPGGFAPDYMRRNQAMLDLTVAMADAGRVVASICHGPWMLCSARRTDGSPLAKGIRATCFSACKDDLINGQRRRVDELGGVADAVSQTSRCE